MTRKKPAGAFKAEAQASIYFAAKLLDGGFWCETDVLWAAAHCGPDVALRRIARAETELRRAKKALQLWSKSI